MQKQSKAEWQAERDRRVAEYEAKQEARLAEMKQRILDADPIVSTEDFEYFHANFDIFWQIGDGYYRWMVAMYEKIAAEVSAEVASGAREPWRDTTASYQRDAAKYKRLQAEAMEWRGGRDAAMGRFAINSGIVGDLRDYLERSEEY